MLYQQQKSLTAFEYFDRTKDYVIKKYEIYHFWNMPEAEPSLFSNCKVNIASHVFYLVFDSESLLKHQPTNYFCLE